MDLFAVELGVIPALLGLFTGIGQFFSGIAAFFFGWYADFHGVKKALIVTLILCICAFGIYSLAVYWWMVIFSIILLYISRATIIPFADIILVGTTEARSRATAIGFVRAFWAFVGSFAPIVAALTITAFGGINVEGIRPLFVISAFLNIFVLILVARFLKLDYPRLEMKRSFKQKMDIGSKINFFLQNFQEFLKEKNLKPYLLVNIIRRASNAISAPFIYLWMVNVKGADENILGTFGFLSLITWALLQLPAGIIADRIGRVKTFILLEAFRYIGTIWLILCPAPEQLIIVGILGACGLMLGTEGSGIGGVSFIPLMVLSWEAVPEDKRGRWHGIISFLSSFNILAALLAGIMWQAGLMVQVLIIPLILEACFALPLLLTVPETSRL